MPKCQFIPVSKPTVEPRDLRAVEAAMRTNWLSAGPIVEEFEAALADLTGYPHVVAVSSCTAALFLALRLHPKTTTWLSGPGKFVVPALTFAATAHSVVHAGFKVKFVDVDPRTWLVRPEADRLSWPLVPVDLYGSLVDREHIRRWENEGLVVIEDAAHAIGADLHDRAETVCLSFYATKNITTLGEGGAILTRNGELAEQARVMRQQGMDENAWDRTKGGDYPDTYSVVEHGYKMNLTDPQAAMGLEQLKRLPNWFQRRWELAVNYGIWESRLLGSLSCPTWLDGAIPHLYPVLLPHRIKRPAFMKAMRERGIGVGVHYRALTEEPCYSGAAGTCPEAEAIGRRVVSLPLYPTLTDHQQRRVMRAFEEELCRRQSQ